ncbi:MAG TPA: hypothetical protein VGB02_13300 [Pyrinomonadaceae bacterium]|jgi:hypothetical protein
MGRIIIQNREQFEPAIKRAKNKGDILVAQLTNVMRTYEVIDLKNDQINHVFLNNDDLTGGLISCWCTPNTDRKICTHAGAVFLLDLIEAEMDLINRYKNRTF